MTDREETKELIEVAVENASGLMAGATIGGIVAVMIKSGVKNTPENRVYAKKYANEIGLKIR